MNEPQYTEPERRLIGFARSLTSDQLAQAARQGFRTVATAMPLIKKLSEVSPQAFTDRLILDISRPLNELFDYLHAAQSADEVREARPEAMYFPEPAIDAYELALPRQNWTQEFELEILSGPARVRLFAMRFEHHRIELLCDYADAADDVDQPGLATALRHRAAIELWNEVERGAVHFFPLADLPEERSSRAAAGLVRTYLQTFSGKRALRRALPREPHFSAETLDHYLIDRFLGALDTHFVDRSNLPEDFAKFLSKRKAQSIVEADRQRSRSGDLSGERFNFRTEVEAARPVFELPLKYTARTPYNGAHDGPLPPVARGGLE